MIKMLVSTYYNGKQYEQGEVYPVDAQTEKRWIKNGIGEATKESKTPTVDETPEPIPETAYVDGLSKRTKK